MEKNESDSGKSHEEQAIGHEPENESPGVAQLPDPDAGLSDEDRAKIVSVIRQLEPVIVACG